MRKFETGATRNSDEGRYNPARSIGWRAMAAYANWVEKHATLPDGSKRPTDNWKKGFPLDAIEVSLGRHAMEFLAAVERGDYEAADESAMGIWFNCQAYVFEREKAKEAEEKLEGMPINPEDWTPAEEYLKMILPSKGSIEKPEPVKVPVEAFTNEPQSDNTIWRKFFGS